MTENVYKNNMNYYRLNITILSGRNLVPMDSGGTSDPYAVFLIDNEEIFRSKEVKKDLNPVWRETCQILLDELTVAFKIQIYDKDIMVKDDFMGEAFLPLSALQVNRTDVMELDLTPGTNKSLRKMVSKHNVHLGSIELETRIERISKSDYNMLMSTEKSRPKQSYRRTIKGVSDYVFTSPSPSLTRHEVSSRRNTRQASLYNNFAYTMNSDHTDVIPVESFVEKRRSKANLNENLTVKVHVLIVQAIGLPPMDNGLNSDPYCKIILGKDKQKTNIIKETMNPKWRQGFVFDWNPFSGNDELELKVYDKDLGREDDFIGSCSVYLSDIEVDKSHVFWLELQNERSRMKTSVGRIHFIVSPSGVPNEIKEDVVDGQNKPLVKPFQKIDETELIERFGLLKTFENLEDVGYLRLKIIKAGHIHNPELMSSQCDPYVVVKLLNHRVQTCVMKNEKDPVWNKQFHIPIEDLLEPLEIIVYNSDQWNKSKSIIGKIVLSLPSLRNGRTVTKQLPLKKKNLRGLIKDGSGNNTYIHIEMTLYYNRIRAAVRLFHPRNLKYICEDKSDTFHIQTLKKNRERLTAIFDNAVDINQVAAEYVRIIRWENKPKTALVFAGYMTFVWLFELWMLPLFLLIPFILNLGRKGNPFDSMDYIEVEHLEETKDENEKNGQPPLVKIQGIALTIQNVLGYVASQLESLLNVFNFSTPLISWLAAFMFLGSAIVLYFIPFRILLLLYGVHKFTKRLRNPDKEDNVEILDFLRHVPDSQELRDFCESDTISKTERKRKATLHRNVEKDSYVI